MSCLLLEQIDANGMVMSYVNICINIVRLIRLGKQVYFYVCHQIHRHCITIPLLSTPPIISINLTGIITFICKVLSIVFQICNSFTDLGTPQLCLNTAQGKYNRNPLTLMSYERHGMSDHVGFPNNGDDVSIPWRHNGKNYTLLGVLMVSNGSCVTLIVNGVHFHWLWIRFIDTLILHL